MMTAEKIEQEDHGKSQAAAQLESIREMVEALRKAQEANDDKATDEASETIHQDALSVEVRRGWHQVGMPLETDIEEYRVLLCTGGPAVQITGTLNEHQMPDEIRLQYQDWFQPWRDYFLTQEDKEAIADYLSCFYFGE
jgi:hypothetical protein